MMRAGLSTIGAAFAAAVIAMTTGSSVQAAPLTQDDFRLETTANLVSLCSADEKDPLYTAGRNFCHGFIVGTYRAVVAEEMATRSRRKMFCPPSTTPTRDQAIAAFVSWASSQTKTLASSPTDGFVEYLTTQFPCR